VIVRGRNLLLMMFVAMLVIGALPVILPALAQAPDTIYVDPASISWSEPTNHIGDTFTVSIKYKQASPAKSVDGFQFVITWDPSKLEVYPLGITNPSWGNYRTLCGGSMRIPGDDMSSSVSNTLGEIFPAPSEVDNAAPIGITVDFTLATIQFKVKNFAYPTATTIHIVKGPYKTAPVSTKFVVAGVDYEGFGTADGSFTFAPAANQPPVAAFTYSPAVPVAGFDTVNFDCSGSYDPDGLGIKNMTINFGEGSPQTKTSPPWTFSHLYMSPATYTVTLLVWDVGKVPYYPELSDTEIKTVKVIPPALPSDVDVFTIKTWLGRTTLYRERGTGSDAPGSAFAPGETVTLRGYAYYAEEAQEGVPVTFEVRRPDTSVMVSLVELTNAAGNATVTFKLPMGTAHGTYTVTASCMIFGESFFDTLDMPVGDIIVINSVTPSAATVARGSSISFSVSVTNIDLYDAYPVLLSVSVKDKIGQSLGAVSSDLTVAPGTSTYSLSFPVPTFAVKGYPATAEANALTNWPSLGGVAYCPAKTASFEIV